MWTYVFSLKYGSINSVVVPDNVHTISSKIEQPEAHLDGLILMLFIAAPTTV